MKSDLQSKIAIPARAAFVACILVCAVFFIPGKQACAAEKVRAVKDEAGLLTPRQEDELSLLLLNLEKKTGVRVAVLTNADNKCPEPIVAYPEMSGKEIVFGPENEILLLFCNHGGRDYEIKAALGRGTGLVMNEGEVERAAKESMKPYCEKQQYDRCVMGGVLGVAERVAAENNMTLKEIMFADAPAKSVPATSCIRKQSSFWIPAAFAGLLLGGVVGVLARKFAPDRVRAFFARRGGGGGKWMNGFGGGFGGW